MSLFPGRGVGGPYPAVPDAAAEVAIDTAGLEILGRTECLRLLATAPIGRIVFTDNALPAVQPVGFAMWGTDIVICTSPDSALARATCDAVVAFEADQYDPVGFTGWSVTVVGFSRPAVEPGERAELQQLGLRSWPPGPALHFVRVETEILTGRRIPDHGTSAGAPPPSAAPDP